MGMMISISIVSHGQIDLIENLLHDLNHYCNDSSYEVILTLNLPEAIPFASDSFFFPIRVIQNKFSVGFASNHNQAFKVSSGQFFCVLNPDVRLVDNPFQTLLTLLISNVGVAAPLVLNQKGDLECSARFFPTPFKIICKVLGGCKGGEYVIKNQPIRPDWVGGMFMLFTRPVFERLNGFDERYFLYYEDVDLCARLYLLDYQVILSPDARIIHDAQRSSHSKIKYLKWHLVSMLRFFCSTVFFRVMWKKVTRKLPK